MAKQRKQTEAGTQKQSTVSVQVPVREVPGDESSYALSYRGLNVQVAIPPDLAETWRQVVYALRTDHTTLPSGKHVETGADAFRWLVNQVKVRGAGSGR